MSSFSHSASSSPTNKLSLLTEEEIEPYVRKKKCVSDARKKMLGLNDEEQNQLRTTINSRERRRMHDLNDAHEELRSCLPYEQGANARKLSKISTIVLACNWIRQLTNENARLTTENESLRRQLNSKDPAPVPFVAAPYSIPCIRAFGQQCLCVACVSLLAKPKSPE